MDENDYHIKAALYHLLGHYEFAERATFTGPYCQFCVDAKQLAEEHYKKWVNPKRWCKFCVVTKESCEKYRELHDKLKTAFFNMTQYLISQYLDLPKR
jgi:hypothetical protein